MRRIILGDCLDVLPTLGTAFARLSYIDPPFNTGARQARRRLRVAADPNGSRVGFAGRRYRSETIDSASFEDRFDDYERFLLERIEASLPCLTPDGSLFVHLDSREVHHVKVALDRMLGRDRFMNEIIWAYDFGGRPKRRWPAKHDTILWYALRPGEHVVEFEAMDRLPYMAPGLVTPEKAARGKTPTDVWWQTVVPTNSREKTGYPTQKPLKILERIGYGAEGVSNGREALDALRARPYDIVLMDVSMPEMDGLEATRRIRAELPQDRQPWIIAVTASALTGDRDRCMEAGMDDYIAKPVSVKGIRHAMERAIAEAA